MRHTSALCSLHKLINSGRKDAVAPAIFFVMLIKSHKTLTNICTAFVNSTMTNFFSCHWWQEIDDINAIPPTRSNPVPFVFEGCISHNWAREPRKSYNGQQYVTWKKSNTRSTAAVFLLVLCRLHRYPFLPYLQFLYYTLLYSIFHIFPCYLLCISYSDVSQVLNSICTFPLVFPVQLSAGKKRTGCTSPQWICWA